MLGWDVMEIVYLGHSCFLLKTKDSRVVIDPYDKEIGFKMPKVSADTVTVSHDHKDHDNVEAVSGEPMVINGSGEYEIKGVGITGMSSFHDDKDGKERGKNIVFVFDTEELRIVHLGDLGHKLDKKQLDELDGVDVLMVPVGGEFTIDFKQAKEVVNQISPSIVIPMHFKTKDHNKSFDKLTSVKEFVTELGIEPKKENKLKIKKLDLPEEMELVILEKNG